MDTYLMDLTTEQINKKTSCIDMCSTSEILEMINSEDSLVPLAVKKEIPNISEVVDTIVERIKKGGRLFYIGAGTSGRIGILDASECPPTFGTDPELVQGVIAGGCDAIFKSVEGAEDSEDMGRQVIHEKGISKKDSIVGITASGRTPFVLGAVREAKKIGAVTVGISSNSTSKINDEVDMAITPIVGPEVIAGSTRMKSGTAQKLVLNMITTSVMIKLGKVYGNLMVDLQPNNEKLLHRAVRIVMYATRSDEGIAKKYLEISGYNPKIAIVMINAGVNRERAEKLLAKAGGFVSKAISFHKQECSNE